MKKINRSTVIINGRPIDFLRTISEIIEFDNVYVVQTEAESGETMYDSFKIDRVFGISKIDGEILWKRPGIKISKQKRKKKIILFNEIDEYDLIVYAMSLIFYIDPETGNIIGQEQVK